MLNKRKFSAFETTQACVFQGFIILQLIVPRIWKEITKFVVFFQRLRHKSVPLLSKDSSRNRIFFASKVTKWLNWLPGLFFGLSGQSEHLDRTLHRGDSWNQLCDNAITSSLGNLHFIPFQFIFKIIEKIFINAFRYSKVKDVFLHLSITGNCSPK